MAEKEAESLRTAFQAKVLSDMFPSSCVKFFVDVDGETYLVIGPGFCCKNLQPWQAYAFAL